MMMSCPIQPPSSLFCSSAAAAAAVAMVGAGGGAGGTFTTAEQLLDMGGGVVPPQPLIAAANSSPPHPLFPTIAKLSTTTTHQGEVGVAGACLQQHHHHNQQQQQQAQQQIAPTPGAWFFQQSPIDGTAVDVASSITTIHGLSDNGTAALTTSTGPPAPPVALSPPPGALAQQQLIARFGPRHTTESVEVPSSEHVAEIVGRQGCKIKALRAKTNTYIKTPVRGEEPVFVVTGRHEDVLEAKREIECAAEHFTQIRASRRHSQGSCPAPGHVTAYVRVPLRVVGLVVGPKGNTIKRIQQDTHTYIITPSREREPIFEVTGLPQNVEAARREIEQHIYQRTGNMPITDSSASIANYDLHTAALQAQHVALHAAATNTMNRPNYGALAVTSAMATTTRQFQQQQTQQQQLAAQQQLHSLNNTFHHAAASVQFNHPQRPQQLQQNTANLGLSLGDLNGCFRNQQQQHHHQPDFVSPHDIGGTKLYSSAATSPPPSFGPIGATGGSIGGGGAVAQHPSLGTSVSSNNLHALLGALELDGVTSHHQGHQSQQQQQQDHFSSADFKMAGGGGSALLLLRSSSNGYGGGIAQQQQSNASSAFSPWRMPSGAVDTMSQNDFLDMLSSTSPSPLFSASSGGGGGGGSGSGGCNSSSYSGGSCGIGSFVGAAGLSSVNSTSRDEGLGDSPTNSFGKPNGPDPYQHLMTIWADVCDTTNLLNGGNDCGKSTSSDQQANNELPKEKVVNNSGGEELKIVG